MRQITNKIATFLFDIIAAAKGYTFKKVETIAECNDANHFYEHEATCPDQLLKDKIKLHRVGKVNFIAYHKGTAVGAIRLSDPWMASQPHEYYGLDEYAISYEIQDLLIKNRKDLNEQFIMLGLLKTMYTFSVRHSVLRWSAGKLKNVCRILNSYCYESVSAEIGRKNGSHPLNEYLDTKKIKEATFSIEVKNLDPTGTLKKHLRHWLEKREMPLWSDSKIFSTSKTGTGLRLTLR